MAYFNSQWQSGKLFCYFHFSKSSCWPFAPLSILLNVLLMRNISMRICRELWPVSPSSNWGPLFLLWIQQEHPISLIWDMREVSINCIQVFQSHLSLVTCTSYLSFTSSCIQPKLLVMFLPLVLVDNPSTIPMITPPLYRWY